jgi:hypothetical protein
MAMSSEKDVLELEDRRFSAMVAEDFKSLDALVHDELVYTHSSSLVDTKVSWLESMRLRKTRYRKVACSNRKVRVFGDVALITGSADIEAEIAGQPKSSSTPGRRRRRAGASSLGSQRRALREAGGKRRSARGRGASGYAAPLRAAERPRPHRLALRLRQRPVRRVLRAGRRPPDGKLRSAGILR